MRSDREGNCVIGNRGEGGRERKYRKSGNLD